MAVRRLPYFMGCLLPPRGKTMSWDSPVEPPRETKPKRGLEFHTESLSVTGEMIPDTLYVY